MSSNPYRPRFFSSLVRSCYDGEFYERIREISFLRALFFLFSLSLVIAAIALVTLAFFWSQLFPTQEAFVQDFEDQFPEVQMSFDGTTFQSEPSEITLFLGFDETARLRLSQENNSHQSLRLQINTEKQLDDALQDPPQALGVYLYNDGLYAATGFSGQSAVYESFEFQREINADKKLLSVFIQSGFPIAQDWIKNLLLVTGPMMIFFYHFVGAWILALIFSLIGVMTLLMKKQKIQYSFLIKLSFYSSVPALVIAMATAFFGISVSFLPVLVYSAFYLYGLSVYE